MLQTYITRSCA